MTRSRSLLHHGFWNALSQSSSLLLFVLLFLAGRWLGAEDFGRFSYALAFVFLFDFFFDPGLYHLLIREIARDPGSARRYLSHAITWKLAVAPVALLVILTSVRGLQESAVTFQCVLLIAAGHVFHTIKEALRAGLVARERFDLDAIGLIGERALLLVLGATVLWWEQGVVALCGVFFAVRAAILVVVAALAHRYVAPLSLGRDLGFLRTLLTTALPMGAFYVTLNVYNYVDTVMLGSIRGDLEVGWYNAGYRVYEGTLMVAGVVGTVFLPRLSRLYQDDRSAVADLLARGLKYVWTLGLIVGANGLLVAEPIIVLPFGDEYARAVPAFAVLLIGVPAVYCVGFLQLSLIAMDRQRSILSVALVGLVANVALNAVMIPTRGYVGAAISTVAVEAAILGLLVWTLLGAGLSIPWRRTALAPLAVVGIPFACVWIGAGSPEAGELALLVFGMDVAIVALAFLFGVVDAEERRGLRDALAGLLGRTDRTDEP